MAVRMDRLQKKLRELQNRYLDNEYKIEERMIKKHMIVSIVRTKGIGRRPHKVSMKRDG
jgi:hypothetical protein